MKRTVIQQLLQQLNMKLADINENRCLIICGGAALILSNYDKEETADIDLLSPSRDSLLKKLAEDIAKENHGLRPDWLNPHASIFFTKHNPLPAGWESRLVETFSGSHLQVRSLSPQDMLFSKICSHVERELDEDDIRALASSREMFDTAVLEMLKIDTFKNTTTQLIIDELKIRLGFSDDDH
jgi:hypothetical protein